MAPSRLPDLCLCRSLHHPSFSFFVVSLCFCLLYFSFMLSPTHSFPCPQPAVTGGVLEASGTLALQVSSSILLIPPSLSSFTSSASYNLLLIYVAFYALFSLTSVSCYPWRPRSFRSFASADLFIIPPSPSSFSSSASVYYTFNLCCLLRISSLILSRLLRVASSKLSERWFYRSLQSLHLSAWLLHNFLLLLLLCSVLTCLLFI